MDRLSTYDWTLAAIVIFFGLHGAYRGLAHQLIRLAGLILGVVLALRFASAAAPWFAWAGAAAPWVAFLAIYALVLLAAYWFAGLLDDWLRRWRLRAYDRHMGALIGLLKGVALCILISVGVSHLSDYCRTHIGQTLAGKVCFGAYNTISPLLPNDWRRLLPPPR